MPATASTLLSDSGWVATGRRRLFSVVLFGGAAAGTCELRTLGDTGRLLWKVGTDGAAQIREFALRGLDFPAGIFAVLSSEISTAVFEWR